jgi:TonB family protein
MEQRLIAQVEPIYPNEARMERIQGDIRLQVRIAADGTVQEANLVSGPPQLVAAAIAAVKQWKYRPTIVSDHPVPAVTVVNVHFQLPSRDK